MLKRTFRIVVALTLVMLLTSMARATSEQSVSPRRQSRADRHDVDRLWSADTTRWKRSETAGTGRSERMAADNSAASPTSPAAGTGKEETRETATRESALWTSRSSIPATSARVLPPLVLTSQNVTDCLAESGRWTLTAFSGSVSLVGADTDRLNLSRSLCYIGITAPRGYIIVVKPVQLKNCNGDIGLVVQDSKVRKSMDYLFGPKPARTRTLLHCANSYYRGPWRPERLHLFIKPGGTLRFLVMLTRISRYGDNDQRPANESSFVVEFTSLPPSTSLLNIQHTNPFSGFITTPGWDGVTHSFISMDTQATVRVPSEHVVMVSVFAIEIPGHWRKCRDSYVALYADSALEQMLMICCDKTKPVPEVYPLRQLYVHVLLDIDVLVRGFKLHFSFHPSSNRPRQLVRGTWNCSVPEWPQFQHHFPCNLQAECEGLEDEAPCPYTSQGCGPGRISVAGRCYVYFSNTVDKYLGKKDDGITLPSASAQGVLLTWVRADEKCRSLGAQLASLGSFSEMQAVSRVLRGTGNPPAFIGMTPVEVSAPYVYKDMWRHLDGTVAHYTSHMPRGGVESTPEAALLDEEKIDKIPRNQEQLGSFLCEPPYVGDARASVRHPVSINSTLLWREDAFFLPCPGGHVTHSFLACDHHSACFAHSDVCEAPLDPPPPSFACGNDGRHVPYTLVCDHRSDCGDRGDESFCVYPPCDVASQFSCSNGACIALDQVCDDVPHCRDASDEEMCGWLRKDIDNSVTIKPPAVIVFNGHGGTQVLPMNETDEQGVPVCPDTHFQCSEDGYCLPVFVRCNHMYDCPGHEDEKGCDSYHCPGFYRCRDSSVCVHRMDRCDGVYHCPQRDDELLCNATCPESCTCYGLAFFCTEVFLVALFPQLRYLDATGSGLTDGDFDNSTMLVYLNLAHCDVLHIDRLSLRNLQIIDLSHNHLTAITGRHIEQLPELRTLTLANNPLTNIFQSDNMSSSRFENLHTLDLSGVSMPRIDFSPLGVFPNLHTLNLTRCGVDTVLGGGFQSQRLLHVLDLRGCPFTFFPRGVFEGLGKLDTVFSDNYRLCCPVTLPAHFNPAQCLAPSDEVSSCQALLRLDVYRVFLSIFSVLGLLGNLVSFVVRAVVNKVNPKMGFELFVANLCVSDFLMGIYLTIIGVADRLYLGTYLWNDVQWRNSTGCKVAGFLSLLSNEVSAFIICLITLDRFLVLRFPFSRLRFRRSSALVVSGLVWALGLLMATLPLLTPHWRFYSQTGICIPLPITRTDFPGHQYAFRVMIVLNFVLFLLIALGQLVIYSTVQSNKMRHDGHDDSSSYKSRDLTLARRLITIAVSDFLCWFPIGVLGLLAASGVRVSGEVNVAMAIFVLPLNSAINPFLYTLNMVLERRRRAREQRLMKVLLAQSRGASSSQAARLEQCSAEDALSLLKRWVDKGVLSRERVSGCVLGGDDARTLSQK